MSAIHAEIRLRTYVIRRLVETLLLVLAVLVVMFVIINLSPGDPVYLIGGEFGDPVYYQMLRHQFGLDRPLYERLFFFFENALTGNLGFSLRNQQPVLSVILGRLPATVLLMGVANLLTIVVGIWLGVMSAKQRGRWTDAFLSSTALATYSLPVFWLGILLIIIFSIQLRWLPSGGMITLGKPLIGFDYVLDLGKHLILPALALASAWTALIMRMTRASMLEVLGADYIVTARAKGLPENTVIYGHALRNASIPVVTIIGVQIGLIFSGAVLTETVFSWPGIGRLLYDSIAARDYPVLMGIFLFVSLSVIVVNLVTDLIYAYLDPRVRYR
jgi:peptide/nickel transport system permease protein